MLAHSSLGPGIPYLMQTISTDERPWSSHAGRARSPKQSMLGGLHPRVLAGQGCCMGSNRVVRTTTASALPTQVTVRLTAASCVQTGSMESTGFRNIECDKIVVGSCRFDGERIPGDCARTHRALPDHSCARPRRNG